MRFVLIPSAKSRPALIVETCEKADEQAIERFRDFLYGASCSHGLLFDQDTCIILRDHFSSMEKDSIEVDQRLPTGAVLAALGPRQFGNLDERVQRWLYMLSTRWDDALPPEPEIATHFFADIVPAASGSAVHALRAEGAR